MRTRLTTKDTSIRCLLFWRPGADFSRRCAYPMIALTFLLTHPPSIRELNPARASHSKGERGKKNGSERNSPDPATRQCLLRRLRQEVEVFMASAAKGNKVFQPLLCV